MRKPKENLGTCPCPMCGGQAFVRRAETRKRLAEGQEPPRQGGYVGNLYLYCVEPDGAPRCGVVQCTGPKAQARIRELATWAGEPPPAPRQAAAPEPAPKPAPAPAPSAKPAPAPAPPPKPAPAAKKVDLWEM